MSPVKLFDELEQIITQSGYILRKEKGNFKSSNCTIEGADYLVLNKLHPIETQIAILAQFIYEKKLDQVFIKPVVRKELNKIWTSRSYFQQDPFERISE